MEGCSSTPPSGNAAGSRSSWRGGCSRASGPSRRTGTPRTSVSASRTVKHWTAYFEEQAATSREITAGLELDAPCGRADLMDRNLRWVLLHMIEETARHAGHADIIRESIDGSTGIH
ncbi:DUF664 domain-containing protein [Streptomyces sp. NPDC048680]|uniref:mycothiol transferase n=1 Tax=Streptomyces sp. NPDC048680 TaxID=3155492 RepID=UPI0034468DE6